MPSLRRRAQAPPTPQAEAFSESEEFGEDEEMVEEEMLADEAEEGIDGEGEEDGDEEPLGKRALQPACIHACIDLSQHVGVFTPRYGPEIMHTLGVLDIILSQPHLSY